MSADPTLATVPFEFRYRGPNGVWPRFSGFLTVAIILALWYKALPPGFQGLGFPGIYGATWGSVLIVTLLTPVAVTIALLYYNWISVTADDSALTVREKFDQPVRMEYADIESVKAGPALVHPEIGWIEGYYFEIVSKTGNTLRFCLPGKQRAILLEYLKGRSLRVEQRDEKARSPLEILLSDITKDS